MKEKINYTRRFFAIFITELVIAVISILFLLPSCSPKVIEHVRTEYKTEYRDSTVYRDSLVYITLPAESSTNHLALGDKSHLETSVAESDAWVDSTGLHHTIANKRDPLPFHLTYPERTIVASATSNHSEILTRYVKIPKELTWWQRFRLSVFPWLLGAVVLLALWTCRKWLVRLL